MKHCARLLRVAALAAVVIAAPVFTGCELFGIEQEWILTNESKYQISVQCEDTGAPEFILEPNTSRKSMAAPAGWDVQGQEKPKEDLIEIEKITRDRKYIWKNKEPKHVEITIKT